MARTDPRNSTRYWWDRHVSGLSLLHADFTTHEYPPHSHEAFVVAITEIGGSIIKSRGVIEEATGSRLFVFNPAEPHSGIMGWSRRWRYRGLYLTLPAIQEVAKGLGIEAVPYFTQNMLGDADLIDAFLALHRALEDGRDPLRERELLVGSFGVLFRRHGSGGGRIASPPGDREPLAKAIEVMRARYAEELGLGEMAAAARLTIFQLIGLCKRMTGLTPHAYLTQLRLNAACRHLRLGLPISEAAILAGFYDQSALTKHFKRRYGITPLQFAVAARQRASLLP